MAKQKKPHNKLSAKKEVQKKDKKDVSKPLSPPSTCLYGKRGCLKNILLSLTYIGLVLSIASAIYFFLPKIKIYPGESLNPSNPFKTPFIIENQTALSIYNIEFSCVLGRIEAKESNQLIGNIGTKFTNDPIPILRGNESTTTFCASFKTLTPVTFADIDVTVKYKPKYFLKQKSLSMRFNTYPNRDGNLFWFPKALSEK